MGINYVRDEGAARVVGEQIRVAGGTAEVFGADVSVPDQCADLVERVVSRFGSLDALVNNAGTYSGSSLEQSSADLVNRLFALNVFGTIATTRAALPHLVRAAGAHGAGSASVVNITSVAARAEWGGASVYCATKSAVEALTRCHAAELGPKGVRVNAVAPGVTETDINRAGLTPEFRKRVGDATALGRVGEVRDIAPLVAFLVGPSAGWITGQVIDADGGYRP